MAELGPLCKYKEEYDESIIEHARNGLGTYEIAVEYDVAFETMRNWTRLVKSFSDAYARAKTIQTAGIFKKMRSNEDNPKANDRMTSLRLRHEAGMAETRALSIPDIAKGTHADKVLTILRYCQDKGLAPDEFNKLIIAIGTVAKIDEVTDLRKIVEDLEDKE